MHHNICFCGEVTKVSILCFPIEIRIKALTALVGPLSLSIATDKRGYPHNIFHISSRKHTLWVLIRSTSARCF